MSCIGRVEREQRIAAMRAQSGEQQTLEQRGDEHDAWHESLTDVTEGCSGKRHLGPTAEALTKGVHSFESVGYVCEAGKKRHLGPSSEDLIKEGGRLRGRHLGPLTQSDEDQGFAQSVLQTQQQKRHLGPEATDLRLRMNVGLQQKRHPGPDTEELGLGLNGNLPQKRHLGPDKEELGLSGNLHVQQQRHVGPGVDELSMLALGKQQAKRHLGPSAAETKEIGAVDLYSGQQHKRHLGPTVDEVRELSLKSKLQNMQKRHLGPTAAEAEELERAAATTFEGSNSGVGKKRHLGPTLEEIGVLRAQARVSYGTVSNTKENEEEQELAEDAPSQQQLKALHNHGVAEVSWPCTKAEAAVLLREIREVRLGNDLTETKE